MARTTVRDVSAGCSLMLTASLLAGAINQLRQPHSGDRAVHVTGAKARVISRNYFTGTYRVKKDSGEVTFWCDNECVVP